MRYDDHDLRPTTRETILNFAQDIFSLLSIGSFVITLTFWAPEFVTWVRG